MKQEEFEQRYAARWDEFEKQLTLIQKRRGWSFRQREAGVDADFPAKYRRICHDLALARDRQYGADMVDRLNRLALDGHNVLYGARADRSSGMLHFVLGGFARCVRNDRRYVLLAAMLFLIPFAGMLLALQVFPDFIYYVMRPHQVNEFEQMYSPDAAHLGRQRDADSAIAMFGLYIWNNIRIAFQCFAGGLLFGVGAVFFLLFNGFFIGSVAGHLTQIGYGVQFYSFVAGHSALELTAIMLSGAAGLKLGHALVAPGALTRKSALMVAAREATRIMYGVAGMLLLAAFLEAFWSPLTSVDALLKYGVGIALWLATVAYFVASGGKSGT